MSSPTLGMVWENMITIPAKFPTKHISYHYLLCRHSLPRPPPSLPQVVCERSEVLASGCAVSRAFPSYSRKTPAASPQTVSVGFVVVGEAAAPITEEDVKCLTALCEGELVWGYGSMGVWQHGGMAVWGYGSMEVWQHGGMAAWRYGSMEVWQHGGMAVWRYGSMGVWQYGGMAAWRYGGMGL